jgi:hypothetical protein
VILLAVGVIYHPVDVDAITSIHCQNEGKPPRAEIGARLDSMREQNRQKQTKQNTENIEQQESAVRNKQHFIKNIALLSGKSINNLTLCQGYTLILNYL